MPIQISGEPIHHTKLIALDAQNNETLVSSASPLAVVTPHSRNIGESISDSGNISIVGGRDKDGNAEYIKVLENKSLLVSMANSSQATGMGLYSNIAGDFTAAVQSDNQNIIKLSGFGSTLEAKQVAFGVIKVQDTTTGTWEDVDLSAVTISGDTITCGNISDGASGWETTDEVIVILLGPIKAYDKDSDVSKNVVQNPTWSRYTSYENLISVQSLTNEYANFGSEIDMQGYTRLGVFIVIDANNSQDADLQVLGKYESGSSFNFIINSIPEISLWAGTGTDTNIYYEFDVGTIPYIQIQAKAELPAGTAGDLTIYINKVWR